MNREMFEAIDNALVSWKELASKCIADKILDTKAIIKLPFPIVLPNGVEVNSIGYIKCGPTIHAIFVKYDDNKEPDFCITKEVAVEIVKHLMQNKDKNDNNR